MAGGLPASTEGARTAARDLGHRRIRGHARVTHQQTSDKGTTRLK